MTSKSSKAFCRWRERMGFSYREAARSLGVCMASVGLYTAGKRKNNKEDDERLVEVPLSILLACSAIEQKLPPIK